MKKMFDATVSFLLILVFTFVLPACDKKNVEPDENISVYDEAATLYKTEVNKTENGESVFAAENTTEDAEKSLTASSNTQPSESAITENPATTKEEITTKIFNPAPSSAPNMENNQSASAVPSDTSNATQGLISAKTLKKIRAIYDRADTKPQTVRSVQQLAILTSICAATDGAGPISVTSASLNGEDVTLLTLGGVQFVEGQATTVEESKLASYGKPNDYLTAVTELIENNTIPSGKPLFVSGISLGGMIAQQLLSCHKLLKSHRITVKAVVAFGSPLTSPLERHGVRVVRFTDRYDMVPKLGEMPLLKKLKNTDDRSGLLDSIKKLNATEKIARSGKHILPVEAHALSYTSDACWNSFDFLGSKKKENVLELKEEMTFYPAPKRKQ